MSGLNSGAPRTSRRTIDDLPQIDVNRLRHQFPRGVKTVTIAVNGAPHTISLARRPGELGGEIIKLVCPCGAKRWHLYVANGKVGCRKCLRLGYARHWHRGASVMSLVRRLRKQLGADLTPFSALPPRPFHGGRAAARHDRIKLAILNAEAEALAGLTGMLVREASRNGRR
jgi:hypothetical protein